MTEPLNSNVYIYIFFFLAASGLSCSMQDLLCIMLDLFLVIHVDSLVVALRLSCCAACGILVP